MTTIATDGKVMVSDSKAVGDFVELGHTKKVFKLKNGDLIGMCGDKQETLPVVNYFNGGEKPKIEGYLSGMILKANGKLRRFESNLVPWPITAPHSIGSGCGHAMGAMMAGASAYESVKIAAKLDECTGGRIKTYKKTR